MNTPPIDPALLSGLLGTFLPPLIAVVQQPHWENWARALMTALICLAVGILQAAASHALTPADYLKDILIILVAANATYRGFWRPTIAPAIEAATSSKAIQS